MSTIAIPGSMQDLVDQGLVALGDIQQALAGRAESTPIYSALGADVLDQVLAGSGLSEEAAERVRDEWANPARAAARRWARQTASDVDLLASSATAQQLADELAVNPTTVTRWHARQAVIGFADGQGRLRLPRWQFTSEGPLPGWAKVAPRAAGLPITMLAALMRTAQGELAGQTPIEWLSGGGDPEPVAALVDGLSAW
ncbi:MAG TPA: hypothetical protein VF277_00105 [Steroidobacteraceae bacterium]